MTDDLQDLSCEEIADAATGRIPFTDRHSRALRYEDTARRVADIMTYRQLQAALAPSILERLFDLGERIVKAFRPKPR